MKSSWEARAEKRKLTLELLEARKRVKELEHEVDHLDDKCTALQKLTSVYSVPGLMESAELQRGCSVQDAKHV
jgi:hypothetical protein